MPCSDGGCYTPSYETTRKIDELTRLLCMACDAIDKDHMNVELRLWKALHDDRDKRRLEREAKETVERKQRRKETLQREIESSEARLRVFKQELAES